MNLSFIKTHKLLSVIVALIILGGAAFFIFKNLDHQEMQIGYSTTVVSQQPFEVSLSSSGQLSATDQIDITSEVEGQLVNIYASKGDEVLKGDVLAVVDSSDYELKTEEAYVDYQISQLELEELVSPTDDSDITSAENSLKNAQESLVKTQAEQAKDYKAKYDDIDQAETDLSEAYEDAYNDAADTFLEFPDTITDLREFIFSYDITEEMDSFDQTNISLLKVTFNPESYADEASFNALLVNLEEDYYTSKEKYDESFEEYKTISRYSSEEKIEQLLNDTIDALRQTSDTLKLAINILDLWSQARINNDLEVYSIISDYQSSLKSHISTINSHLTTLLNALNTIEETKKSIEDYEEDLEEMDLNYPIEIAQLERTIEEKENSLEDLKEGATDSEIRSKELEVTEKLNSYKEALQNLEDCKIVAPFDGVIAEVNSSEGEDLNTGDSIFTIITNQKMVEISLNELDIKDVAVGQQANITFDSVDGETFVGEVAEVDVLGEVDQGVVSYSVKVVFDTDNELVKIGMTANIEIITYENEGALLVPVASIITLNNENFVSVLENNEPVQKKVTVGQSNDLYIEVTDGLSVGDKVINSAVVRSSSQKTTNTNEGSSLFSPMGDGGGPQMMR